MNTDMELLVLVLGVCMAILLAGVLTAKFVLGVYAPFIDDRDYIRMEIARSHGAERVHWKHELQRLYMGAIPFIGQYLVRKSREKSRKRRQGR